MSSSFSPFELQAARTAADLLLGGQVQPGIGELRQLKDAIHAAIPPKLRIGRGITWVVERLGDLLAAVCAEERQEKTLVETLFIHLEAGDHLLGVPIFLMGHYGLSHPAEVLPFFEQAADLPDWVGREFAQGAFRPLITPHTEFVLPWLRQMVVSKSPNQRRFASETLRPVTTNQWLTRQPEVSLSVLRLLFREPHPYPRTSVGNNLSDLSRRQPELIFQVVAELVSMGDKNSFWIAERACRNLVKKHPQRVLDVLGVDEYHYKDRKFYRI